MAAATAVGNSEVAQFIAAASRCARLHLLVDRCRVRDERARATLHLDLEVEVGMKAIRQGEMDPKVRDRGMCRDFSVGEAGDFDLQILHVDGHLKDRCVIGCCQRLDPRRPDQC